MCVLPFVPQVHRFQYIGENVITFVPQPGDQVNVT